MNESVVFGIPVFNGERTLPRALDSLRAQSHEDLRIIITDNGSTDRTAEISRRYSKADPRFEYHYFERGSVAASFHRSLKLATSTYFAWAACDDYWDRDFVSTCLSRVQPEHGFVWPNWWVGDLDLGRGSASPVHPFSFVSHGHPRYRTLSFINTHHAYHKCNIVYSLFRRDVLTEAYAKQDISDDGALGAVLLQSAPGLIVDDVLFRKDFPASRSRPNLARRIWGLTSGRRRRTDEQALREAIEHTVERLIGLMPHYRDEILEIYGHYTQKALSAPVSADFQRRLDTEFGLHDG